MFKTLSKFTLSLIILLNINTSYANEFYCKEAYTKKLERIDKNRLVRDIGKGVIGVTLVVGGIAAPIIIYGGSVGGGAVLTSLITAPTASGLIDLLDRENGLKLALSFIDFSMMDREELKQEKYQEYIDEKLAYHNGRNTVQVTREQVLESYPYDEFEMYSIVDLTLDEINKVRKRKDLNPISYTQFQEEIKTILETDTFCKRRAETFRKMKRLLRKNLKNKVI